MEDKVTAAMLYDLVACPHRVAMDLYGDTRERDTPNPFVQMLWEKGSLFERETIEALDIPFLDLSKYSGEEKERLTLEAMDAGEPLIFGGRITTDDLLGIPDLLRKEPNGYIAGDIKSGAGLEGSEDLSKPKPHYAVQLGLYTDILERLGMSSGRRAFIWDIHGEEVIYDFSEVQGVRDPRTLWQDYQEALELALAIVGHRDRTTPASSAKCKLCHWYSACRKHLEENDDLTLIPELGRSKRDVMCSQIPTVRVLASTDLDQFITGKKTVFPRIGPPTLFKFQHRARLQTTPDAKAVLTSPVTLPSHALELFFDIEVDPMRDICYLHGFVERHDGDNANEHFVYFFAEEPMPASEEKAFAEAIRYMTERRPCAIYYYSKYERTIYKKLQSKYPDVCTTEEIESLFDPSDSVDLLYDVVKKSTEWPTTDHSLKTLAKFLGFSWRDVDPSGAASIEWFNQWVETGDPAVRQRLLDYNEDDCRATRVLLDGIRKLK